MAAVVEWMCQRKGLNLSRELATVVTEAPSHFSGRLATPHADSKSSQENGNQ
jgi:hypothetical protein